MRGRWVIVTAFALLWGSSPGLRAQVSDAPLPTRIAVVNMNAAIAATAEGSKVTEDLQKKFEPRRQELESKQREVQALQQRYQQQSTTLSEPERRRLARQLEEEQRSLKRSQEDYQADSQIESQDAFNRLVDKMQQIISQYAAQNGYVLVLDYSQIPVFYIHKSIDITDDLVRRFNTANPVESATTTAAPAPSPASAPANPGSGNP
ncbi:MAG: OmpH family outer membrane protein [Acidobacteria bacterium]|nr:OmpH family outer membrane protein [Acidobacteriota bacterium]